MKKLLSIFLLLALLCSLSACASNNPTSSFNIQFIDVGQGDAALVECDGQYMLIDGGDKTGGHKVYDE